MKYSVKIGQEFPCDAAEQNSISVEVTVEDDASSHLADLRSQRKNWPMAIANGAIYGTGLLLAICVTSSALLGWATGDYSVLKSIAESGRDLLALGVRLIQKS